MLASGGGGVWGQQGYLSRCGCYSPGSGGGAPRIGCHHAEPQVNHTIALEFDPRSHTGRSSWPSGTRWTSPRPLEQQPSISTVTPEDGRTVGHGSPGHGTVLQGSCSSPSPEQLQRPSGTAARVLLQRRNRRLSPTSFTRLKHVLLHSDQLVHRVHGPSATSGRETDNGRR